MSNENTEAEMRHKVPDGSASVTAMILQIFDAINVPYDVAIGAAYQILGNVLVMSAASVEDAMKNATNISDSLKAHIPAAYASRVKAEAEEGASETV